MRGHRTLSCLKPDQWPRSDRRAWVRVLARSDRFDPASRPSRWSTPTRHGVEVSYGRWLSWLCCNGILRPRLAPSERVTPERVRDYIRDLRLRNAPWTVSLRVARLHMALAAMAPAEDFSWLRALKRQLDRDAVPTRRIELRVRPSSDLLRFGIRLMEHAEAPGGKSSIGRSAQYRDGLIISLLAARPVRLSNLTNIQIGRNLLRIGAGFHLVYEANETKSRKPLEFEVPAQIVPFLNRYIDHYRPLLAACAGRWKRARRQMKCSDTALWVSAHGTALTARGIFCRMCELTKQEYGVAISPHLFRHCATTSIATEDSENILTTLALLGHSTLATVERTYNQASTITAARRFHETILKLRSAAEAPEQQKG